jgi:ribonuclease P protein component
MVLTISKNNLDVFKFGIVVSKKVGNAVNRNYYKRIFRVFFRTNKPIFKQGYNYVFILRNHVKDYSFNELEEIFLFLVNKSKNEKLIN